MSIRYDTESKIFTERQEEILLIANSAIGKFLLGADSKLSVVKVTPNAVISLLGWKAEDQPVFKGVFYSGQGNNSEILLPILEQLDILRELYPRYSPIGRDKFIQAVEHYAGYVRTNFPLIFLDGPTDFEAATGGTGGIYALDADYATARAAASATGAEAGAKNEIVGGSYEIARWFCPTDFTAITAGSDVTVATGSIFPTARNTTTDDTCKFILTTQAATSSVANDDFNNLTLNSPTTYGTFGAFSTLNLSAYNAITMDAGFLTLVEAGAGGFIKMGIRATGDIDATTPTTRSFLTMSTTNGERTKFTITWTPVGGGAKLDLMSKIW